MSKDTRPDQLVVFLPTQATPSAGERELLARLRAGDEAAFVDLVRRWSRTMLRVARGHVSTDDSAQEVVQETWLAVIKGLDGFEGRSSLRTWVFRVLVNTAKTRGVTESRMTPMSSLATGDDDGAIVDPDRFRGPADRYPGHWTSAGAPQRWDGDPPRGALRVEVRALLEAALAGLPQRQRNVVVLRDIEGCGSDEVCQILGLTRENQRVLLHRGRAKLRGALETYYRGGS